MLMKCVGRENLEQFFRVAQKSIWGLLQYTHYTCNRKKHIRGVCDIIEEWYGILSVADPDQAFGRGSQIWGRQKCLHLHTKSCLQ